jgi:hypothetical protein
MQIRLQNVREVGRYCNESTGKTVNIKRGVRASRGDSWYFYTFRGSRVFVPEHELRSIWKKQTA